MLSKSLIQLLLSSSPAIATLLAAPNAQQPLHAFSSSSSSPPPPQLDPKAPPYRADLLALHKHLVEIPSTSGQEHDAGTFLVDYFIAHNWHYELQPVPPRANTPPTKARFNVIAWPPSPLPAHRPAPKVLVTSHYDCVPPHIPYSIEAPDDGGPVTARTRIAGRCTVDAKGSVATQLTAVHELLAAGALAPQDVMVLYVVGEEVSGDGMREFSARNASALGIRAGVFGEPTKLKLACGHKGAMSCVISARGKAGHSGYPELGKSATEVLMRSLVKVLDRDLGSSERYGNTTVNVGLLEGGVALNVIPAHANASLLIRIALEPEDSGHEAVRKKLVQTLNSVDDEALTVDCPVGQGATHCDCDVDGKSCLQLGGLSGLLLTSFLCPGFETIIANYGTDIPHLKGDHKRYLYGPGTILVAHGDDEALTVGDLEDAVEGNKKLILHGLKQ